MSVRSTKDNLSVEIGLHLKCGSESDTKSEQSVNSAEIFFRNLRNLPF